MSQDRQEGALAPKEEWHPSPAESFEIDFMTSQGQEITKAMGDMGFRFQRGEPDTGIVRYHGNRNNGDGTTVEIIIRKGKDYKSPKEIAEEADEQATRDVHNAASRHADPDVGESDLPEQG